MAGLLPLLLLLLPAGPAGASKDDCFSKLFTASGECCRVCNVGEGVVQPCGLNQTVCEPCLDSVTFSDTASATEPCKPCTQCEGLQSMSAPCVETDDAVCRCAYGYFQDEASGSCRECRVCQAGFGLMFPCKDSQDTVCEECPEGTFSSEANFVDPCLPCTTCEENEVLVRECTPVADAECRGLHPRWTTPAPAPAASESPEPVTGEPPGTEAGASTAADTATTVMGSSRPVVTHGTSDNLIPVYCSILAAVVVGLVAYIAFKRWNSCKQNKQGANNRPVNQTPSPEGEKLHSDSGISVDSQSLHDQQPPGQGTQGPAPKADGSLYSALPASKQEEVEKLLGSSAEDTWRQLAGELGYKEELLDAFGREESPARALLAHWASRESATLDALLAALRRAQRGDIADSLASESTATSPV
ncbi:tumor necrosis factor receptor superfamily member 16 [Lonchura striata]|uniref:Tumor necrosis factor receptor superfamily member 16 n=1 Tax=Lonchura striata TaxID=40157 RepID=A0A218UHQ6_9PASE|nr:tumor necrosis factor receptor superfamily member 16 [Lonchura striata domestica]OWK53118.1 Tumor necrosis factor receptor superfamily member 16 [Lonchura striata domestica]